MLPKFSSRRWSLSGLNPPWSSLPSIYKEICMGNNVDTLLDISRGGAAWAAGALDGVFGHHVGMAKLENRSKEIIQALRELLRAANDANLKKLYGIVVAHEVLGAVDSLLNQAQADIETDHGERLAAVGRYFSTGAGHPDAVKFGMVLLGAAGTPDDTQIAMGLGAHDEFTFYAAVVLGRTAADPEQRIWELAHRVHGWGRIQTVERLAHTQDSRIRDWLLREGFRNLVMNEYLACICARAGRLHEALASSQVDPELLDGAADIFRALLTGGPAEGVDDYEHAAEAAEAYVHHVWSDRWLELKHFLAVASLAR
jgi:hypothetical protein